MAYVYRHFIPQNIAPKGAKCIGVYDSNGNKVCTIPLGGLAPPEGEPLYSVGIGSDLHTFVNPNVAWHPNPKLHAALNEFEQRGCAFVVFSGDLTQTGFWVETKVDGVTTHVVDEAQMAVFYEICAEHDIPIYVLPGNHESYYGKPLADNLALWEKYTGRSVLSYTVEHGNDLFILCGQPRDTAVMSDEDFVWLGTTLEANKGKRCFVFVHSHIDDNVEGGVEDSGNPAFARENSIFGYWGAEKTATFISLMQSYPNAILFHGHTHITFEGQTFDPAANYSEENGFKSVHIPSLGAPRTLTSEDGTWVADDAGSQGYIMDVYEDYIVLNGWDFVGVNPVPLGTYKIPT